KIMLENPDVPCFLLGHSTGGAVVLKGVAVRPYQNQTGRNHPDFTSCACKTSASDSWGRGTDILSDSTQVPIQGSQQARHPGVARPRRTASEVL
uniref:Serine aminopeptidase S33 domain-containing protein n=1 Tax=Aegilops tauschii subsp. strangulata TaxID=200361 RepID=A0A453EDG5_AEGTS